MTRKTFILSIVQAFLACLAICCLLIPDFVSAPGILSLSFSSLFHFNDPIGILSTISLLLILIQIGLLVYKALKIRKPTYLVSGFVFLFSGFAFLISCQALFRFLESSGFDKFGSIIALLSVLMTPLILVFSILDFKNNKEERK